MFNADPLWYFINERHNIYLKKHRGDPFPWTDDPILQQYRFCNSFRELDTVTIWIRENWREPYADHPNLPFAMSVARQINWPDTLEEIGFPDTWDPERVQRIMADKKARGEKVYTGAYMLTGTLGGTKTEQTVFKILDPLFKDPPPVEKTLEDTWRHYLARPGFSGFMAYEVVTDLRHTKWLCDAPDIMTWANAGPGAKRGLHRIHGRRPVYITANGKEKLSDKLPNEQALEEMRELLEIANGPNSPIQDHVPLPLEIRDVEMCLCEVDKMLRVKNGEGRPRSKYRRGIVK